MVLLLHEPTTVGKAKGIIYSIVYTKGGGGSGKKLRPSVFVARKRKHRHHSDSSSIPSLALSSPQPVWRRKHQH